MILLFQTKTVLITVVLLAESAKWCCKFTKKCIFDRKESNIIKIKKDKKFIAVNKIGKEIATFGNTEVEKHKFHQWKSPIWKMIVKDISKKVVSDRVPFGKKGLNISLGTKMVKKLRPYA